MKTFTTLTSLGILVVILAGCGLNTSQNPINPPDSGSTQELTGNAINTGEITEEESPSLTTGRFIDSPAYEVELLSGDDIQNIYEDVDAFYSITHLSTGKWTYLAVSSGSWTTTMNQRNFHITQDNTTSTTGSLEDEAYNHYNIANIDWYQVSAPIDRVLLLTETPDRTFVLDFDDPSGLQNKMSLDDVQDMLEYFVIE